MRKVKNISEIFEKVAQGNSRIMIKKHNITIKTECGHHMSRPPNIIVNQIKIRSAL